MSLEETEVNVGGVKFKGMHIAIVLGIISSIGGTIWTASSIYSRLEAVEAYEIPDIQPLTEEVHLIKQELDDNDISKLQGNLATLQANLTTIMEQQAKLLLIQERVVEAEKAVTEMETEVEKAELAVSRIDKFDEFLQGMDDRFKKLDKEIDDLWEGLDALANPLG
tara:strand:- start:606 stop:1103 length:498 start_codon:yes stop_codon:yes gene_type:complete